LHVPVAVNARGEKLSKQAAARPIDARRAAEEIGAALAFLGQPPARSLEEAARQWDPALIAARRVQETAR
jgi:glutamyl-Q tRNA(Asp) synthetase